ncbi:MAG: SIMPL domain-containing protein [Muribaculum sp.]|nr:SIMPL domain-containing protein [Muribaculum sp.]
MSNTSTDKSAACGRLIPAALIAAAIVILGICLKCGIDNIAFRDREVTVKGLAEREVPADLVTWPITYSVAGDDLTTLYDQVNANNDKIIKFLTSNGIDRKDISVNPPDTYNALSNQYRSGNFNYNYSINCTVTVTTKMVDKVRELLNRQSELLKQGIAFSNSYINYQFTGLNTIKPEMIGEATKAAREAAAQFAADSDSRVGKIKHASQGQFSIEDSDSSTPYMKKVRVVTTIVYYLKD